jgi:hypothetical protein
MKEDIRYANEEIITEKTVTEEAIMTEEPKRCINCGTELTDNFCPHCGQKADVARLTTKGFLKRGIQDFCKLNSGFIFTAWKLVTQPWNVIRDFIHGRRVNYTTPVTMLITLMLYMGLLQLALGTSGDMGFNADFQVREDTSAFTRHAVNGIKYLFESSLFWIFFTSFPATIATYLTYRKHGGKRYNTAEYLAAAIYVFCAMIIIQIIFTPLGLISEQLEHYTNLILEGVLVLVTLYKAFNIPKRSTRILRMILCVLNIFIFIALFAIILIAIIGAILGILRFIN